MLTYAFALVDSGERVVAAGLGVLFALRVPLGLPYDEPAHWETVLFYATEHRLPVLGERGAPYEAQLGPVYYALAAIVVNLTPSDDQTHAGDGAATGRRGPPAQFSLSSPTDSAGC